MTEQLIVNINTIDELDNFFHEQVIDRMKSKQDGTDIQPKKLVKLILSQELQSMGMEVISEILQMKAMDRALNDTDVKNLKDKTSVHGSVTFEKNILPILCNNKKITYH